MNKHGCVPKANIVKKENSPMKQSSMNKQMKQMSKNMKDMKKGK